MKPLEIETKKKKFLFNINEDIEAYQKWKEKDPEGHKNLVYDKWIKQKKETQIGQIHTMEIGNPGFGRIEYVIEEIKENGDVYGIWKSGRAFEFDPEDVI